MPVVIGGDNLPSLVGIGLTYLLNIGKGGQWHHCKLNRRVKHNEQKSPIHELLYVAVHTAASIFFYFVSSELQLAL